MAHVSILIRLHWAAAIIVSIAALLAPAIWNGFPLIYPDTGGYLERPFDGTLEIGRSALYGTLLAVGIPLQFWPTVMIQALLTLWIIALVLKVHGLGGKPLLFALLMIGLSALTSLPWYVGQLMPDIFLPLAVLALYVLAFHRGVLAHWEIGALVAFIAMAMAFHMTIVALALALVFVFAALKPVASYLRMPTPALVLPAAALVVGLLAGPISNLGITGTFAFTPGSTTFLFGRMVQDGIVARYLADHCPDNTLRLCTHRDELPTTANDWLWNDRSPLFKLGWWSGFEPEANRIIRESLVRYPGRHVVTAVSSATGQLTHFQTGEGMHSIDTGHSEAVLVQHAPSAAEPLRASRQQHNQFDFTLIRMIQVPLAWLSMAALVLVIGFRRNFADRTSAALAATCLFALLTNAAICGIFSGPDPRYQSRIVWLAPFAAAVAFLARRADDRSGCVRG
jgi:hypothetical protein